MEIWVIEAKQTPLPNSRWINSLDLGYIMFWLENWTKGVETYFREGKEFYTVKKSYSIITKSDWIRENYEKLSLSTHPKFDIKFIPMIITDILPITKKINGVTIVNLLVLRQIIADRGMER